LETRRLALPAHILLCLLLALFASWRFVAPAEAQSQQELARMEAELKAAHPKLVEVCFDVSGSMKNLGVFSPLREALIQLLRSGLRPGDQCVIVAFDTAPRVLYDHRLRDDVEVDQVIDALPGDVTPDKIGTNIRRPHHDAMGRAASVRMPSSYIILVSDSFNDTPSPADPSRADYEKYYRLDANGIARLTDYPASAENRDYERLLHGRQRLAITTWGLGVGIDERTGRPIERLPRGRPEHGDEEPAPAPPPAAPHDTPTPIPWIPIALGAAALAGVIGWMVMNQPAHVSLSEGPKRYQNYALRPRQSIVLGGSTARGDERGYPISGTLQPCGYLERGLRDFTLRPSEATSAGVSALFVNNEEIGQARRIDYSDDIKIRVNRPGQGLPAAEHRLQFGRAIEEDGS
jgi:hypothetical protein